MFCSCTPEMYKPSQQAFFPYISRGYTAQQNSQPVNYISSSPRLARRDVYQTRVGRATTGLEAVPGPSADRGVMITRATGAIGPCQWSFDRFDRSCSCVLLRCVVSSPRTRPSRNTEYVTPLCVASTGAPGCAPLTRLVSNLWLLSHRLHLPRNPQNR